MPQGLARPAAFAIGTVIILFVAPQLRAGDATRPERGEGYRLFHHVFIPNDPVAGGGDGLGPVHNDVSCVGCHKQAGAGGAGPRDMNVDVLVRMPSTGKNGTDISRDAQRAGKLHPDFGQQPPSRGAVMLHRSATTAGYDAWRLRLLGVKVPKNPSLDELLRLESNLAERQRRTGAVDEYKVQGVVLRHVQRSTPALFGAGLIDAIPDDVIRQAARATHQENHGIHGRVPVSNAERADPLGDPNAPGNELRSRVGRFGWRGQTSSLKQFVLNACANELGLEVPNHAQAAHPQAPEYQAPGLDLTKAQCEQLTAFVAGLPRPRQILPDDPGQLKEIERGEAVFDSVGCAVCHPRRLGNVDGLFSDLLLHDLGPGLGDPAGANAELPPPLPGLSAIPGADTNLITQLVSFYTGGAVTNSPELRQQWRTPPLWGVRDSAPYLHDGRAESLDQAITLHGGEARRVAQAYKALSAEDRRRLLAFLGTLAAPEVE